jgi:CRP-like cAMP-binding protein
MTRPPLSPGCWGSVLAAQAATQTCIECGYKDACFTEAVRAEPQITEALERKLTARESDDDARATVRNRVNRYLLHRKRAPNSTPDRDMKRPDALTRRFEEQRIDVTKIKEGVNPFDQAAHPVYFQATKFILEGVPFLPKDIAEEIRTLVDYTPSSLASEVSRFLTCLVNANVLERKERKILCLSQ